MMELVSAIGSTSAFLVVLIWVILQVTGKAYVKHNPSELTEIKKTLYEIRDVMNAHHQFVVNRLEDVWRKINQ